MKPNYLVLETPKAVATLVLVTVAFLCLGSSLLLVSSCLLCSLFSLGVLRLLPLFFVLRSWLFFFSLLCFFEKKQRNESLLVALFSSLYYVCSEGGGGGATGDEVGALVLAGQCTSLLLSLQSSLSRLPWFCFRLPPPVSTVFPFLPFVAFFFWCSVVLWHQQEEKSESN